MKTIFAFTLLLCFRFGFYGYAQDSNLVENTFRTMYMVNGQSSESLWKNHLFFAITHRFSEPVSSGSKEFWGMDSYANIRLGLAYAFTDNFFIGFGRTRIGKIYDGQFKYKLLAQKKRGMPITLTAFGQIGVKTDEFTEEQEPFLGFNDRLSYAAQFMLARKITDWFSLELVPTYTHQNLATLPDQVNSRFSLGTAVQVNLTMGISITAEYYFNEFVDRPQCDKCCRNIS